MTPIPIIIAWLATTPSGKALTATPTANGLIVEPKTPLPAPNKTMALATMVSIPAITIVADNKA